jgi:2-polyprenyl-3-methyl-5-hydroxy-6-metoxy-1,4-benzoquinol methylase
MTNSDAYQSQLQQTSAYWDQAAASFDDEPDHGLRNPLILKTWSAFLKAHLPSAPAKILDIGCGTGSLSVVVAGLGHSVTAIDLSPAMIALAQAKAASQALAIDFQVMDAAFPQLPLQSFDLILCRHLLWALPEPAQVLSRWRNLLRPLGGLLLIEGHWWTGGGLHAHEITALLPPGFAPAAVHDLSQIPGLWGQPIHDERYAVIANLAAL